MKEKKICCVFNIAPHYNEAIYLLMADELNCDFYLGDHVSYNIQLMDYAKLKNLRKVLENYYIVGNFYWQKGTLNLPFKSYSGYILTGEPFCLSTWYILILNRFLNKKSYLWTHGWYGKEQGLRKVIKKMFFKLADSFLLYGEYAKQLMINEGFKEEKLKVVYNSMDLYSQLKVREKLYSKPIFNEYFKNDYPVLLFIGRIETRKKVDLLIEVLSKLRFDGLMLNLVLIGKHSEDTNILKLISEFNLEDVIWDFGPCYEEEKLGELIYNADLCVVPGDVGLTAMHSMVYGLPVLTHNNFSNHGPEFEAIMPGLTGDFFEEDSLQSLAIKIKEWVCMEAERRKAIRMYCYEVIEKKYNPKVQIEILKRMLENN